jgi:penicillin-binding protein 2
MNAAHGTFDKNAQKNFIAPAGAAVVLDPRDGSVRALASLPTFNPADFVGGISTPQFAALNAPEAHNPLTDRAIAGQYSPGSTFKLATAVAALNTHLVDPRTTINDGGRYQVQHCTGGQCVFRNANEEAHGLVNMSRAITVSSDVYFYGLGDRFWQGRSTYGVTAIQDAAQQLGFGTKTGIGLLGELGGRVPTPQTRADLHAAHPKAFPEGNWRTGDNINLSIGQGELVVTPLQLAQAYSSFAMAGRGYLPRIATDALSVTRDGSKVAMVFPATPINGVTISDDVLNPIVTGLRGVVSDPKGTAYNAFAGFPLGAWPVAGKTGTAQVTKKQDTALFAAFMPVGNPQWCVSVVIEEAGFGGSVAAPVARHILDAALGNTNDNAADIVPSGID